MGDIFNREIDAVSLDKWIMEHASDRELKDLFLNMDVALKYIHEHGYCIEEFYPSKIFILNHSTQQIQFKKLMELPTDMNTRHQFIEEDIFNSSFIQIGIYSHTLKYLKPEFLKDNFDSFTTFIPEENVPYYRGVVERGASVYLSDFTLERSKRDFEKLESELSSEGESVGKQMVMSNDHNVLVDSISNNKINDQIYRQINGLKDSAFIRILVIPTIILGSLLLIGVISFIISCFR